MMPAAVPFRERQRLERRAEILRVAREIFLDRGYAGTSMDEIAERAGVGKGTIYLHFERKDDLLVALWEEAIGQFAPRMSTILAGDGSSLEKLDGCLRLFSEFIDQNGDFLMAATPEIKALLHARLRPEESMRELIRSLAAVIRQGQAEGSIDPGIQPEIAAAILPALPGIPTRVGELLGTERPSTAEILATVRQILFHGISAPGGGPGK